MKTISFQLWYTYRKFRKPQWNFPKSITPLESPKMPMCSFCVCFGGCTFPLLRAAFLFVSRWAIHTHFNAKLPMSVVFRTCKISRSCNSSAFSLLKILVPFWDKIPMVLVISFPLAPRRGVGHFWLFLTFRKPSNFFGGGIFGERRSLRPIVSQRGQIPQKC